MKAPVTKVSTKGQVILPKTIRDQKHWGPGTSLTVEVTEQGVLLKDAAVFASTKPENVRGMLHYDGPPKTIEAIAVEVKRRLARGRY